MNKNFKIKLDLIFNILHMQALIGNPHSKSKYDLGWHLAYFQNSFHLQPFVCINTDVYSKVRDWKLNLMDISSLTEVISY